MIINPLHCTDFYKTGHHRQYPEGTNLVYSNLTARSGKLAEKLYDDNKVVFFGLQYFIKDFLIDSWNKNFFEKDKGQVLYTYQRRLDHALGGHNDVEHVAALHDLGYLPIKIKALPEGARVPVGVPMLTIVNTHPEFFWLTNYIECALSNYLWLPITSATTAFEYKQLLIMYAAMTGVDQDFVQIQAHDFSLRGMANMEAAAISGAAHLTSFIGTDSIPAIDLLEHYYNAPTRVVKPPVGVSVPATEHSVMCMGGEKDEIETFRDLIHRVYPTGNVSIVSDTWDFWNVIGSMLPVLKNEIMTRDGRVIIRPDSGDPVNIICGDTLSGIDTLEYKGAVECLWDIFGGTVNGKGYRELDPHIGLIYGDSITLDRANKIMDHLERKGFASSNIVLGVGSYTYQHKTRDSWGMAVKSTYGEVQGWPREIFKNPKTDDGTKKSLRGLLQVNTVDGEYKVFDRCEKVEEKLGDLKVVFVNGELRQTTSLNDIRNKLREEL